MHKKVIGMVVPPAGDLVPLEATALYPEGIEFIARGLGISGVEAASFDVALLRLPGVIADLRQRGAQAISLMGTSISFYGGWGGNRRLLQRMQEAAGDIPVTTMANAVVRGLKKRNVTRLVVASAYTPYLSQRLLEFLEEAGFEVIADSHLNLTDVNDIHAVGTARLEELGGSLLENNPMAQALLVSCGGLRTAMATEALGRRYNKPIVSSSIAGCHDAVSLLKFARDNPGLRMA